MHIAAKLIKRSANMIFSRPLHCATLTLTFAAHRLLMSC